ncbi:hypothetical protein KPATCC21470_1570 [Kitasatospora purpeofusca]
MGPACIARSTAVQPACTRIVPERDVPFQEIESDTLSIKSRHRDDRDALYAILYPVHPSRLRADRGTIGPS